MQKRYLSTIVLFIAVLVAALFSSSAFAQSPTPVNKVEQDGLIMVCLQAKQGICQRDGGDDCGEGPMGDHTTEVTGNGFRHSADAAKNQIEMWRKVNNTMACARDKFDASMCSGGAPVLLAKGGCETGDDGFECDDQNVFNVLTASKGQVITNAAGNLSQTTSGPIIVLSTSPDTVVHTFYGIQVVDAGVQDVEKTALKLSTFFPPGNQSNCITVKWDPRGTVFDAVSLEPIEGATVTILDSQKQKMPRGPGVPQNPMKTGPDGGYNFIVDPGNYYLTAEKAGYTFPVSETLRDTLQTSSTVQQRFPNENPKNENGSTKFPNDTNWIYLANEVIEEVAGYVKYRHIPLMPKAGQTDIAPKIYDRNINLVCPSDECFQQVYGSCSHYNCVVRVANGGKPVIDPETKKQLEQQVDNNRAFVIDIPNAALNDPAKEIELQAEKIAETLLTPSPTTGIQTRIQNSITSLITYIVPVIEAATSTKFSEVVKLAPIPARVEGYAYDKKLKTVPNAKVRLIVPAMNDRAILTVQADKNGYIQVPQAMLPPVGFEIQILDKNNKVINEMTTSKFIAANKPYLTKNNISLFTRSGVQPQLPSSTPAGVDVPVGENGVNNPSTIDFIQTGTGFETDQTSGAGGGNISDSAPTGEAKTAPQAKQSTDSSMFVLIAVAFVVILAAGGIIMLRMKNKGPHVGNLS